MGVLFAILVGLSAAMSCTEMVAQTMDGDLARAAAEAVAFGVLAAMARWIWRRR